MVFHFITIPYTEIYVQFYKSIMNNNLHIFHKTEMDFFFAIWPQSVARMANCPFIDLRGRRRQDDL